MTESSPVLRVPGSEWAESSRVPRALEAESTESSPVQRVPVSGMPESQPVPRVAGVETADSGRTGILTTFGRQ